jgi:hypothetical protein
MGVRSGTVETSLARVSALNVSPVRFYPCFKELGPGGSAESTHYGKGGGRGQFVAVDPRRAFHAIRAFLAKYNPDPVNRGVCRRAFTQARQFLDLPGARYLRRHNPAGPAGSTTF